MFDWFKKKEKSDEKPRVVIDEEFIVPEATIKSHPLIPEKDYEDFDCFNLVIEKDSKFYRVCYDHSHLIFILKCSYHQYFYEDITKLTNMFSKGKYDYVKEEIVKPFIVKVYKTDAGNYFLQIYQINGKCNYCLQTPSEIYKLVQKAESDNELARITYKHRERCNWVPMPGLYHKTCFSIPRCTVDSDKIDDIEIVDIDAYDSLIEYY